MTLELITSGQSRSVNSSFQLLFGQGKGVNKDPNTAAVVQSALKVAPSQEGDKAIDGTANFSNHDQSFSR